ncbi:MFS transporter [Mycobacterium palustre]|uniref:MFS transporter n=1 Tax=Mycobacterium palustre TaxID=153971 RepID=A0A1X1ZX13_9MYCO|nr:MFS transporter [Mycobacterium palustre]ORW28897.1 MFS transporter [Mycobacterium palustre]
MQVEPTTAGDTGRQPATRLPARQFVAVVSALGGIQLLAMMDGTVAIFALPKIQNELGLSDAARSWVITSYVLAAGGLMLLGGRIGDTIGHKRTLIVGAALFTITSAMCGVAWDGSLLVVARLLKGVAAAIVAPTAMALVATTFPKGPSRNAAMAVFGAMASVGSVVGLVAGGALTEVSWRLAFLVNVPIGLVVIYLSCVALRETVKERMKLDALGGVLATLACTASVLALTTGPETGWPSGVTVGSAAVAVAAFVAFALVERTAENPIVPLGLFFDRNRMATFAATFLTGGVTFTMAVLIALYVQNIMGYGPMRAAIGFIPFGFATAVGAAAASRLVSWFPPRVVVIAGVVVLLGAILCGATLGRGMPYFPDLALPIVVAGIGLGMINVPLGLALIASVGVDQIGPASAVALMLRSLAGPLVMAVVQAAIAARTLRLGGVHGPVKSMTEAQLRALDHGYSYGWMWLGGVVVLIAAMALLIGYTAQQVARAQEVKRAVDAQGR